MKISALIPSTDQVISMKQLVHEAKRAQIDEIIVAAKPWQESELKKLDIKVVPGRSTRGLDYNATAQQATGDVLVLIHQNTTHLPHNLIENIRNVMQDNTIIGGGVDIAFNHPHWFLKIVAWLSNQYRMRLRHIIYADQTIFVRRSIFKKLKGFSAMPIFEDTDFSKRLRQQGKLVFLKGPVVTSAHRFVASGIFLHTLRNQMLKLFYNLGLQPKVLKHIYEQRRTS